MTVIIAISGGSGSGKTTASIYLQQLLGKENCQIISQDNYYKDQSKNFKGDGSLNFDHPDAIDFPLLIEHITQLKDKKSVTIPIYDFKTHTRKKETLLIPSTNFIIIDGILILYDEKLRELFNEILFIDIPEDIRFSRRLKRDLEERGRTPEGVRVQFYSMVKPMHDKYVDPLMSHSHYKAQNDLEVIHYIETIVKKFKENLC